MMTTTAFLGVDIGTFSSKGVVVDRTGRVLAEAHREHQVSRPFPGQVEMDGSVWWQELVGINRELTAGGAFDVAAVGVSGMGPCVLLTDSAGEPIRPAILYGVDTRAQEQIAALTDQLSASAILQRCGSALTSQSVGPKLAWLAQHEPETYRTGRRVFMPSSWLVHQLTGRYVLDHHSASQSTPLYDTNQGSWYRPWWSEICPQVEMPTLLWPDEVAGQVSTSAAAATGLAAGTPVIAGTVDAWAEAASVGALKIGDLMLMYGTTMFLINTVDKPLSAPPLWGTVGVHPGTRNLAGGMASSGAITAWLRELFGGPDYAELLAEAAGSPPGANGLLMLPYFAGERTPISDPRSRGLIAGLSLSHRRGDLYRAALEATAFGVRHNIEVMEAAGARIERLVAVGGGTRGELWTQIVSDVTGREQQICTYSIGASYGVAQLAAATVVDADIDRWNPVTAVIRPRPERLAAYTELYGLYREMYSATADISHSLADRQLASAQR